MDNVKQNVPKITPEFEIEIRFTNERVIKIPQPQHWSVEQDGKDWIKFTYHAFGTGHEQLEAILSDRERYSCTWKSDTSLPEYPRLWIQSAAIEAVCILNKSVVYER